VDFSFAEKGDILSKRLQEIVGKRIDLLEPYFKSFTTNSNKSLCERFTKVLTNRLISSKLCSHVTQVSIIDAGWCMASIQYGDLYED
jgi:hypothetical protein